MISLVLVLDDFQRLGLINTWKWMKFVVVIVFLTWWWVWCDGGERVVIDCAEWGKDTKRAGEFFFFMRWWHGFTWDAALCVGWVYSTVQCQYIPYQTVCDGIYSYRHSTLRFRQAPRLVDWNFFVGFNYFWIRCLDCFWVSFPIPSPVSVCFQSTPSR